MSWNIEGLETKPLRYDIVEPIKQYDLMSLQETWDVETDYCKNALVTLRYIHVQQSVPCAVVGIWEAFWF